MTVKNVHRVGAARARGAVLAGGAMGAKAKKEEDNAAAGGGRTTTLSPGRAVGLLMVKNTHRVGAGDGRRYLLITSSARCWAGRASGE